MLELEQNYNLTQVRYVKTNELIKWPDGMKD